MFEPNGTTQSPLVPSGLPTLTDQEVLQQHNVHIEFLSVGAIVRIGCKSIAFESARKAVEELYSYVCNPKRETERWNKVFNQQ